MFPFQLFIAALCVWLQREQRDVVAVLREEHRVLKAVLSQNSAEVAGLGHAARA